MDMILIPGLWLDASCWDSVLAPLRAAGHRPAALTMPGVGAPASESAGIGMADWVDTAIDHIDAAAGPVVLVGHSAGGNVAWAAAEARPDRVRRVVFVDTVPPAPGLAITGFPTVDGVVPFPGWDFFPEGHTYDVDAATRARTGPLMRSVPARVPADPLPITGDRRYGIPVTLLLGRRDRAKHEARLSQAGPYGEEYRAIADTEVAKIGSGHWPQFTASKRLSRLLIEAADR